MERILKNTLTLAVAGFVLASCASDATIRSRPPAQQWEASSSVKDTVACLIPSITRSVSSATPFGNRIRYIAQVVVPDREFDIVDTGGQVNGYYVFTVNVAGDENSATVKLFQGQSVVPSIKRGMISGITACL